MTDMAAGCAPLGPARDGAIDADELRGLLASEPALLHALPAPETLAYGCRLYRLCNAAAPAGSVCALGAFDGVHLGHRALVSSCIAEARELGAAAVAVTFDPDPADVLVGPEHGSALLPVSDRIRLLASLGLDAVLVVPFTRQTAATTHEAFLREWLVPLVGAISLHVGEDFRMGAGGAGTVFARREVASGLGVRIHGHELVRLGGEPVSATRIRALVRAGNVADTARLLGRYHCVSGVVVQGRGEGTSFGFPTANVSCSKLSCLPAEGVYAGIACVEGRLWPTAVNVGSPRTFGGEEGQAFLEPTLLGFSGDIYGRELTVCFVEWLREPRRFASLEELERTVLGNVEWVRRYVGGSEIGYSRLPGEAGERGAL